jgi:hypothetical protein
VNIFLDDVRNIEDVKWVVLPALASGEYWTVIRSHDAFCKYVDELAEMGVPVKRVCFDHDLAEEHYPGSEDYSSGNTGYDCAKHLAQVIIDNDWPLPEYIVHSLNPVAKDRIDAAMNDVTYFRDKYA